MATSTATKTRKKSKPKVTKADQSAKKQMWAVVLFALGLLVAALTFIEGDKVWRFLHNFLFGIFGCSTYFWAPLLIYAAVTATLDKPLSSVKAKVWQVSLLIIVLSGAFSIFGPGLPHRENLVENVIALYELGVEVSGGGLAGAVFAFPLFSLFGKTGASIIIVLLTFVFVMLSTGSTLIGLFHAAKKPVEGLEESYAEHVRAREERLAAEPEAPQKGKKARDAVVVPPPPPGPPPKFDINVDISGDTIVEPMPEHPVINRAPVKDNVIRLVPDSAVEYIATPASFPEQTVEAERFHPLDEDIIEAERENGIGEIVDRFLDTQEAEAPKTEPLFADGQPAAVYPTATPLTPAPAVYKFPPLSLLKQGVSPSGGDMSEELKNNAQLLVDTLKSFGVQTRITDICRGPAVTRYELQPSAGVKISKITGLSDDIALNLAAAGIRIEAPIPNKAAVGIEVPNKVISMVSIRELIESSEFQNSQNVITTALGKDIAGKITLADIGKMPHVLIAGSTGSGKSVCINSIIMSLLYKYSPDEVKLLMIDPKVVELGVYNGIPHLLVPVVTDPRKAAGALGWAVSEMMNRYKTFAASSVKDLAGYNRLAQSRNDLEPMPKIVIIIDELADLMMAAPGEVEDAICRLAQMARAAGMHLVIATQRPSVDVITGIIKANIPSRIAFAVSSQVDSRTILDMGGAEKLLGRGDMLFYPIGVSKPMRVQGCFVTEGEVEAVVNFITENAAHAYDEAIIEDIDRHAVAAKGAKGDSKGSADDSEDEDDMLPAAIECVVEAGQASTSQLQRRLKLGYARAARIIDQLEQKGIVGPFEGSKPRQVLISKERYLEMKLSGAEDAILSQSHASGVIPMEGGIRPRPDEFDYA